MAPVVVEETELGRPPPLWETLVERAILAAPTASAALERERLGFRKASGCLIRLALVGLLAIVALVVAAYLYARTLL